MDINLKNNNKRNNDLTKDKSNIFSYVNNMLKKLSISKRILIISICIGLLPVLFSVTIHTKFTSKKDELNNYYIREEISTVSSSLDYLNKHLLDSDGTLREESIKDEVERLKIINKQNIEEIKENFEKYKMEHLIDPAKEEPDYYNDFKIKIDKAEKEYNKSDEEYKEQAIANIKDVIDDVKDKLKNATNIEYYMKSNDGNIIRNIFGKDENSILSETIYTDNYKDYMVYSDTFKNSIKISKRMECFSDLLYSDNIKCKVIRISNTLKQGDDIYFHANDAINDNKEKVICLILIILDISIILLCLLVRKKDLEYKGNFITKIYSKLFLEIKLILFIFLLINFGVLLNSIYWDHNESESLIQGIICGTFIYFVSSDIYNSLHKKNSITNTSIVKRIFVIIKKFVSNLNKKTSIIVLLLLILVKVFLDLINIIYFGYCPWWLNGIDFYDASEIIEIFGTIVAFIILVCIIIEFINIYKIDNLVNEIVNGNYKSDIKVNGIGITKNIGENIKNIQSGFSDAIDEAIKSEKMKTELITNVSHDLKTPLTSIINYVDLLSKENISQEEKDRYLEILNDRSLRLKVLIEDLFEAAKATSGTLKYNLENLDPVALLRQALGEFEDKIEECNLTIIKKIPEDKLCIIADGKKTFRAIQNLLSNIIKYSMKNSRVYIDVIEEEQYVLMIFKNISEYQLNFSEEEIIERFKRGDCSRTTEGNGLGLSIAKSLVEGQNGLFKIIIDGDLFKVEVRLKKNVLEN